MHCLIYCQGMKRILKDSIEIRKKNGKLSTIQKQNNYPVFTRTSINFSFSRLIGYIKEENKNSRIKFTRKYVNRKCEKWNLIIQSRQNRWRLRRRRPAAPNNFRSWLRETGSNCHQIWQFRKSLRIKWQKAKISHR